MILPVLACLISVLAHAQTPRFDARAIQTLAAQELKEIRAPGAAVAIVSGDRVEGRQRLQFRAEFFNAFNTPQFQIPNRTFGTATFGTITDVVNDNRDVQLGLKFLW